MVELSNYLLSTVREGNLTLYRGTGDGLAPILVVAPSANPHSVGIVKAFENEFALKAELDADWAARPIALTQFEDRTTLVLEDPGGEPLGQLLGRPLDIPTFLQIAIPLAGALRRAHERGLIHKDIKPANVLVDMASGRAWLTGFGVASRLPREHRIAEPPEVIAGTLAYMAPEQTGRMNRSVDSRSDLYSLGATLYEMLTGALPFATSDPIELIHCHIAREPVPPSELMIAVPGQLSMIVMKLLAKTAEERYQTAAGVEGDLRRCLAAWESSGRIEPFPLGMHDSLGRLMIPERLYGRESEIATLLGAFDRVVAHGGSELVLVSGYSGIGKSSVVNELHKVIVLPRGIFISGKFDLRLKDIPYSTLAQAFQGLIRQIVNGREDDVCRWRDAIREAVGNHGCLLTDLIPDLVLMIGSQPPVAALSALETQLRFQSVFQRFVGVFARPEHPLVIFIDDLQWLDPATLTLIEHLITNPDTRHLLLIGAYRDNEVGPEHPLRVKLEAMRQTDARVAEVVLGPLSVRDVSRLLSDALRSAPAKVWPLAELVHRKTDGNPFFAGQFLTSLAEDGLLKFDPRSRSWSWDFVRIGAKDVTVNLVDLMIGRLRRLPSATQEALKLLACLGNQADFAILATVHGGSEDGTLLATDIVLADLAMHGSFRAAVHAGVIFSQEGSYRFLHDRVQEAAYALIPVKSRVQLHLRIGRLLIKAMPQEKVAEKIFDIVNQLNLGSALVADWTEKERLAELNLLAGRKAKASTAYASACSYLAAGAALLAEEGWQRCYDLALGMWLERAECELLSSNFEQTAAVIAELLDNGRSKIDRAEAYRWRMVLQLVLGDNASAVRTALECLEIFGLAFPESATREQAQAEYDDVRRSMGDRPIESLMDLPSMDNPEIRAVMNVLATLWRSAYHINGTLPQIIACRMVKLTLEHGISDFAWTGFGGLSIFLAPVFHRFEDGERFARLAVEGAERHGFVTQRAGANIFMQMAVVWTRPIESALACIEATIRSAKETGELVYSGYGLEHRLTNLIARGDPLDQMLQEAVAAVGFIRKIKFRHVIDVVLDIQAFIESLRGYATQIDEAALETRIVQVGVPFANCSHWILQLSRHFLFGDPETALAFAERAKPLFWAVQCHIQSVDYRLYHSLAIAAVFLKAPRQRQSELRKTLAENLHLFQKWAESCPSTFLHKFALVAAETARLEEREMEAMRLYEQAIRSAADHGFVQYQALANELAARFCLDCGLPRVADTYLREARNCYIRWGALGKVAQLDKTHPGIGQQAPPTLLTTIEAPVENLDLATVIRTSQAVAGEVVPEKLIETLMMIAVEHAGADRGLLILPREEEQWIEAEARTHLHTVRVRLVGKRVTTSALPTSILHHVVRTQGTVIFDDAAVQNPFSGDGYLGERRVRSLLCLPLVKQTALVGVLYLENNFASHVFTPARIAVLKLLSSQAAISLENARLYSALRVSEASLNEAQQISHTGSWRWRIATGEVSSSAELLRIYGFPPTTQPSYGTLLERVHADDRPWLEQILDRAVSDRRQFEHEYRIALPDGSIKHLQAVGQPDDTKSGEIEFVGTVIDITERRRAEEALKNAQMELARVARLTTMGEFVASIAHEINQPLAAIATNGAACINFLNREKPDLDEAREATVAIVQDANRAGGVIRGLRALATKSEAQLTEFDINEAIREVLALTRMELQRHGVALHTDLFTDDRRIFGDRVQLQQVLLNLIVNGVEAMSAITERPKVLTITSQTNELDGVRVLVEDTGMGLDPATADRIFDPFFTTKPKGMGMGLSICRTLIEAHGGRLSAWQRLPHGAIFQFTVRRAARGRRSVRSNVR